MFCLTTYLKFTVRYSLVSLNGLFKMEKDNCKEDLEMAGYAQSNGLGCGPHSRYYLGRNSIGYLNDKAHSLYHGVLSYRPKKRAGLLDPMELIIIGGIAVAIFMWGPKKIPELARALGVAKKEFVNAQKEYSNTPTNESKTSDDLFIQTARSMGINTEGRTSYQIQEEILARAK